MTRRRALRIALRRLIVVAIGATTIVTCGSTTTARPQGDLTLLPNVGLSVSTVHHQAVPCRTEGAQPGC